MSLVMMILAIFADSIIEYTNFIKLEYPLLNELQQTSVLYVATRLLINLSKHTCVLLKAPIFKMTHQ